MEQNFSSTKLPTVASQQSSIGGVSWQDVNEILNIDEYPAFVQYLAGGDSGAAITGSSFEFPQLPASAVIDGIELSIAGNNTGCYGDVSLNLTGSESKDMGALNGNYGGSDDLWGLDSIDPADIASITATVTTGDVSGGDGYAAVGYMELTVYWHIEVAGSPADVPTRIVYKVYSRNNNYIGELPDVTSNLVIAQDINSAGSAIVITCGKYLNNEVTVEPLLTEDGEVITTENDLPILSTSTETLVTTGNSNDVALFKNSNRVKAWLYNRHYPNGKLVFSGQINKVEFKYGGGDASVKLTVYSDGMDLANYIARGYPFTYTTDQSQTTQNSYVTVFESMAGWNRYGQSFYTGAAVTNVGAISLMLRGTADVTVSLFDGPNGNFIGSVTKAVSFGSATVQQFDFAQLLEVSSVAEYFFTVSVKSGQSIRLYYSTGNPYVDGWMYVSSYGGGSGGGSYAQMDGELYFVTKYGTPTTTATYSSDDPVADMASGILLDYNARGGLITENDFDATGLSLTYTFVVSTVLDALHKILELCPTGYYMNINLGTAQIDIKQVNNAADFTVVRGRHINELNLALSIEQVQNYLLLSGGDTGGGVNLYKQYQDSESAANYGIRTVTKSDNRITLEDTADAIGETFIEENSEETQETTLTVLDEKLDTTQLVPGKTIGFRNFGNFIDDMVLQIVRREINHSAGYAVLTLGRLPVRMNDEMQRINRGLLNEQTINNPAAPS